jgi:hypothetical protein
MNCVTHFRTLLLLAVGMSVVGCGNRAQSLCRKLEQANVAQDCRKGSFPEGPLADAEAVVDFTMVSGGGKGQVFAFGSETVFLAVSKKLSFTYDPSKHGVSTHQGYVKALVMVTLSRDATEADERETRKALGQKP